MSGFGLPDLGAFDEFLTTKKTPAEPNFFDSSGLLNSITPNEDKNDIWELLIQKFLISDEIYETSEMETNGGNSVFIKSKGKRIEIQNVFKGEDDYNRQILKLCKKVNPFYDSNELPKYIFEGRLNLRNKYGTIVNTARCHIVMPPACDVPQVTIAKKTTSLTTLDIIQSSGSMTIQMKDFVKACLKCNLTTVLSGSSGAGKTTFTEAMTKEWPLDIRVGVAEDSPELNLIQENTTYLKSAPRQPGQDIKDEANLDWCVQQLNRMRVDKIIVGETRSKEFFYFLQAANSGCEGSLTTIHASDPKMCLQKMTQFSVMAMPQPIRTANKSIGTTIDIIIQLVRLLDGRYRVASIEEVTDTLGNDDSATIATTALWKYDEATDRWENKSYNMSDKLRVKIEAYGINIKSFM